MSENLNDQAVTKQNEEATASEKKVTAEKTEKKLSIAEEILKKISEKTGKNFDLEELKKANSEKRKSEKEKVEVSSKTDELSIESKETNKAEKDSTALSSEDKKKKGSEQAITETQETIAVEKKVKVLDYSKFSKLELVNKLEELTKVEDIHLIKVDVENIKQSFYKIHNAEIKKLTEEIDKKNEELKEEEEKIEFKAEPDELEIKLKELLKTYKAAKAELIKSQEKEKEENLTKKNEIIEEIKNLINKEEAFNETFNLFRTLQQKWREIGLVPQASVKALWDNYNMSVENFYAYVKINKELRDLDLKKNLEIKSKLCDQAEELLLETNVVNAFKKLQDLHELWREAGPLPPQNKEELWERFKRATTQINKNHQDYFEQLKEEQVNNLKAKTLICDKVDEIAALEITSSKDWDEKSKEIIELQKIWRLIGFAPKKENNSIYQRFRESCDLFFNKKRSFFDGLKGEQNDNLQLKLDLCVQAESLKDRSEWKKTTDEYIALQRKWKEIGPVPRKQSDVVWKRFRVACDFFFNKKSEYYNTIDQVQEENLKLKLELIEKIKNFASTENIGENIQILKDIQNEWTKIGHVPYSKKDEVIIEFRKQLDAKFDGFNMNQKERSNLKFKQKIEHLSAGGHSKEREKLVSQLQKINNDVITLENNIGFFANSKNADSLIQDVKNKIDTTKKKADEIKQKIKMIDNA